jgi:hypothetical protein
MKSIAGARRQKQSGAKEFLAPLFPIFRMIVG